MPTHSHLDILVCGATGNQGNAVATLLLKRGHRVRALTRHPDTPTARALADAGATLVRGDYADTDSLRVAMRGVHALFLMATPYEAGIDAEVAQACSAIDAAAASDIPHLVYSSGASVDQSTEIPHFDSKFAIERHLRASGVPFTVIGPAFFMENFLSPLWLTALKQGELWLALPPDRRIQMIPMASIANVAAMALEQRENFVGQRFDIASDELSGADVAARLSARAGRNIVYVQEPLSAMRALGEDFAIMFDWFDRVGYSVDIDALRDRYPDIELTTFDDWADRFNWPSLLGPAHTA